MNREVRALCLVLLPDSAALDPTNVSTGDCAFRICPFAVPRAAAGNTSLFRYPRECGSAGVCDRSTGECMCFTGYTGKGCGRITCPTSGHVPRAETILREFISPIPESMTHLSPGEADWLSQESDVDVATRTEALLEALIQEAEEEEDREQFGELDYIIFEEEEEEIVPDVRTEPSVSVEDTGPGDECSGHGTCEYIRELRNDLGDDLKLTGGKPTTDQYQHRNLQGKSQSRGCRCDPGWKGVDCGRRACPRSEQHNLQDYSYEVKGVDRVGRRRAGRRAEQQLVTITRPAKPSKSHHQFALTYRSPMFEEATTTTLSVLNLTNAQVEKALNSLPNAMVSAVQAWVHFNTTVTGYHQTEIRLEFDEHANPGDQYMLECRIDYCGDGCNPRLTDPVGQGEGSSCEVTEHESSVARNVECSGRGHCNHDTGTCECFEGYADDACSTQTALV